MTEPSTDTPTVGIVIAAYQAASFLPETLASVHQQTFEDWVCVIVDDGSADDTSLVAEQWAAQDPRFTALRQDNAGHCSARNFGLSHLPSSVEWISIMDADDVWFDDALERLLATAAAAPDCIGAHAVGEFIDVDGETINRGEFPRFGAHRFDGASGVAKPMAIEAPTTFASLFFNSTLFPPGLVLLRSHVYETIGGYDPASVEGDWDLLLRATRLGDIAFTNQTILGYRRHESNVGAHEAIAAACVATRARAFYSPLNSTEQTRVVRNSWRAIQLDAVRDRRRSSIKALRTFDLRSAGRDLMRAAVSLLRWARGRPARPLPVVRSYH